MPYVEAYYKDDCIKHGLVRYFDKDNKIRNEMIGTYGNCKVIDSDSKFQNILFDDNGKLNEINLYMRL